MCGIAGYLRLDGEPAEERVVRAMNDAIVHRGPDSAGYLVEGPLALGMRRLSIIDIAGGDQPIHGPDGRCSIVYNGETYNFREERARLEASGRPFLTRTDTETVLALYERHGVEGVRHMRGMFAYAIWDREARRLVLGRDRMGQKPLHHCRAGGVFLFASEIKSILRGLHELGLPRPEPDRRALAPFLAYGYVPAPRTAFEGIAKLPQAHTMTVGLDGAAEPCIAPYWEPPLEADEVASEEEQLERLDSVLEEAVRLRLVAEVPLGAYLSGGIDSSLVVAMMARTSSSPVETFAIGFEEEDYSELRWARRVAEHLGTLHHEEIVRPDVAGIVGDLLRSFDEPFADSSAIPTFCVARMARKRVTVALSGDGGDELFAGYRRYREADSGGLLAHLPLALRQVLFGRLARVLPAGFPGRARLASLGLGEDERYVHLVSLGLSEWHRDLFRPGFVEAVGDTDPSPWFVEPMRRMAGRDAVARRAFADLMVYLPDDILAKVDRTSMAVSLEARSPLLDHRFVETALRVPTSMKLRGGEGKAILRTLARRMVPAEVIDRPKQGFAVPVSEWINGAWRAEADDLLASVAGPARDLVQESAVRRLLDEHRRGRRDHGQLLWSLMTLESWFRAYVDDRAFAGA